MVRPNRNLGRSGGKVEGSLELPGTRRRYLDVLSPLGLNLSKYHGLVSVEGRTEVPDPSSQHLS